MRNFEKPFIQIYICIILVIYAWTAFEIIRFPYGMDYGEAQLMDQVQRFENQETLYKNTIDKPPYTVANYPPFYHFAVALINTTSKISLFQSGRIVSIIFSMSCGVIIGLFSYHLTDNKLFGILGAALFWGHPYVMIWSSLARVDVMALAFSLLGLYILYRRWDSGTWRILALLCFIISAFTRQSYLLAGPLAGIAWLWHNDRRHALFFGLLYGVSILLIFGMINAITQGGFYTNIIIANINQYDLSRTILMSEKLFAIWPVILISSACIIGLVIQSHYKNQYILMKDSPNQAFIFYGLGFYSVGAFISTLTVGKVGSDVNYFLELITVCTIWCILALQFVFSYKKPIRSIFVGLLFLQLIWVIISGYMINQTTIASHWVRIDNYDNLFLQVKSAALKGKVLSDNYIDMVVLSGQSIYYQPFEYTQLYEAGLWDPTGLSNEIEQKNFPLILTGRDTLESGCCWPQPLLNALKSNYQMEIGNEVVILTPKK